MTFDFNVRGSVKITMQGYISDDLRRCEDIKGTAPTPAKPDLFQISNETDDPLLLRVKDRQKLILNETETDE